MFVLLIQKKNRTYYDILVKIKKKKNIVNIKI